MEAWLTQGIIRHWVDLVVFVAGVGGFFMYVRITVKGLSEKVNWLEKEIGISKAGFEGEFKALRRSIEQEIKEIKKNATDSADKIVEGFRATMYNLQDGESTYMPRSACRAKSEKCQTQLTLLHNAKIDSIAHQVETLCKSVRSIQHDILEIIQRQDKQKKR